MNLTSHMRTVSRRSAYAHLQEIFIYKFSLLLIPNSYKSKSYKVPKYYKNIEVPQRNKCRNILVCAFFKKVHFVYVRAGYVKGYTRNLFGFVCFASKTGCRQMIFSILIGKFYCQAIVCQLIHHYLYKQHVYILICKSK